MGLLITYVITQGSSTPWPAIVGLFLASSCLYLGGMVLNDVYDIEKDRNERPERPIPSGRISLKGASRLGFSLLFFGMVFGWIVAGLAGDWRPAMAATLLGLCVWLYDGPLKKTPLGPLVMGACRSLNVLLGMSLLAGPWQDYHFLIATALGLYIAGVTWFARKEAGESRKIELTLAFLVMVAGIGLLAWLPAWTYDPQTKQTATPYMQMGAWFGLMAMLLFFIGRRMVMAIIEPIPPRVQIGVILALRSYIVIVASVVVPFCGGPPAIPILCLLIPGFLLGRFQRGT
ncbi:4-hydroxybenzoate polyprenyltransferase [Planctomycetales bacterium 10988]|nr:4-hydroxybenzoate polyprenyltransferase [Planctomycetales bacterium 10988]